MGTNTTEKTEWASTKAFWLVQRVELDTTRDGLAAMHLDYMGAAEFEFGEPRKSLERIVAGDPVSSSCELEVSGTSVTVHVVAPAERLEEAMSDMAVWVAAGTPGKELSYFTEVASGNRPAWTDVNVWWSFTNDCLFTLEAHLADEALTRIVEWGASNS